MSRPSLFTSLVLALCMYCPGRCGDVGGQEVNKGADNIICTVLYDNISHTDSTIQDHGFSCLIESGDETCLFDAGRVSDKLMTNVSRLGVDYATIDHIFISHVHSDHTGGLFDILSECNKPTLCMPISYPRQKGESLTDRADADYSAMLQQLTPFVSEIIQTREFASLGDNFYTTGMIEEQSYEQSLILPTSKGLIVITGCAHPGILAIVRRAKELAQQDVYLVIGGFHLGWTDSTQIKTVAQELRQLAKHVGPCHCTGEKAQAIFKAVFADDYIDVYAGLKLRLGEHKLR